MPDPLCAFVGQGAALTAAAWAAAAANADGGGPFQRLGEGRGASINQCETNARRTWHIALGPTDIPDPAHPPPPRAPHLGREKGE